MLLSEALDKALEESWEKSKLLLNVKDQQIPFQCGACGSEDFMFPRSQVDRCMCFKCHTVYGIPT